MDTASIPVIKCLVAVHNGVDALDVLGPLEVLNQAQHNPSDPKTKAFEVVFVAAEEEVSTTQPLCKFKAQASFEQAIKKLSEFDVLIIPGGNSAEILKTKAQPLKLIKAFTDLQIKYPERERTLLSVGTGSLFLAEVGTLSGLCCTTHPDYVVKFENVCAQASMRDLAEKPDVMEERYVVNNLRFGLDDPEQHQFIRRRSDARRPSNARKGSNQWKESNTRRESIVKRAASRLGGLRVITAGGTSCGIDAALYLVSVMVSTETAAEVARVMQHVWTKGVVVDGIDI